MPLVTVRGKANQDSKSAWTERKITVSANIYSGARGGNVRLDSDSELISFEIPSPILPSTSSTSATHSSPFSPSLFPSHPGSLFATLAFLFSHSPSLSLSLSLSIHLSLSLSDALFLPLFLPLFVFESRPGLWRLHTETRAKCISIRAIFYRSHLRVQLPNGEKRQALIWVGVGEGEGKRRERERERGLISQGNVTHEPEKVMLQSITSDAISRCVPLRNFCNFATDCETMRTTRHDSAVVTRTAIRFTRVVFFTAQLSQLLDITPMAKQFW